VTVVDICSGLRTAQNAVSGVDPKVKQHQDMFTKIRLALQEDAIIQTEITALRVLDAVGDLCQVSNFAGFPRLIQLALSRRNSS
jgi:hypothetical protein